MKNVPVQNDNIESPMDIYEDMKFRHGKKLNSRKDLVLKFSIEKSLSLQEIKKILESHVFRFYANEYYPGAIDAEIKENKIIINGSKGAEIKLEIQGDEIIITGNKKNLTFKDLETMKAIAEMIKPNAEIKIVTAGNNTRRFFEQLLAGNKPLIEPIPKKGFPVPHKVHFSFFRKKYNKIINYFTDNIPIKYFTEGEIVAHFKAMKRNKKNTASHVFLEKLLQKRKENPELFKNENRYALFCGIMNEAYREYIHFFMEAGYSEQKIHELGEKYKRDLCSLFTSNLSTHLKDPQRVFNEPIEQVIAAARPRRNLR